MDAEAVFELTSAGKSPASAAGKLIENFRRAHWISLPCVIMSWQVWVARQHCWPGPGSLIDVRKATRWYVIFVQVGIWILLPSLKRSILQNRLNLVIKAFNKLQHTWLTLLYAESRAKLILPFAHAVSLRMNLLLGVPSKMIIFNFYGLPFARFPFDFLNDFRSYWVLYFSGLGCYGQHD